jgi:DNA polymerase III subunit beta
MRVECLTEKLKKSVTVVEKMTGKNLTAPVLNSVYLKAEGSTLTLRATNLDLGIEMSVPARVTESGVVAVPGKILQGTVQNTYSRSIVLESSNSSLTVRASSGISKIAAVPAEEFPEIPKVGGVVCEINVSDFIEGIQSVLYASSVSSIKKELSSVYIYSESSKLIFVATDSFRLAEKIILPKKAKSIRPILLPARNAQEIVQALEFVGGVASLHISERQAAFVCGEMYLVSRIIDGEFPDYKQIIPKKSPTEVVILKQDLVNILKKTIMFSNQFNQVNFDVSVSEKKMVVSSKNSSVGETKDEIPATIKGEDVSIHFNHKYITDCFQSINSDSLSLSFNGDGKPLIIKGVGEPSFLYLVMPMNR